ncbi:YkoF family thiamine/hydroxymethylpyrimidine-binding protein [Enterococcus canis]|nr:YkoF family thiamine/hydroxymethylpyrimidine-binding protein [Enterococcus canis]
MTECSLSKIDITGCRVSLYPMKDDYANTLLKSINETVTEAVWSQTDLFSTLYRGEQASVVDATAALFINTYEPTTHMVGELTFSKGCPGDQEGDSYLNGSQAQPNQALIREKGDFLVHCKYSFYSFGQDYMEEIAHIVALAQEMGLAPQSAHYVTFLTGTAQQLFAYFEAALSYAHEHLPHYVLEATISVNSPSLGGTAHV